jgi:hypothetical protein
MAEVDGERGRGLLLGPVALTALAMVATQFLVRLVIVPQAYWWEDDFFHLAEARTKGLTSDFLVSDYNDHLEILPNFLWWLLTRVTGSSWAPAAVLILVFSVAASAMMFALLRELFGSRPAILLPFAAYLFSPLFLAAYTWLAACIDSLPMQVALLGTAWAMIRLDRTGRRSWWALALVLHVVGLLAWEKGALVLPFALGLQLLVVDAGQPVRERLRSLRRHWLAWLSQVVVLAAYAVVYLTVIDGSERQSVSGVDYLGAVRTTMFRVLVPGLFGAPWKRGDAVNTVYPDPGAALAAVFAVLLGVLVVLSFVRTGRAAAGPWLLAAAYVGADIGLMLWGRAGFLSLVARDPRYITDAVPVVLVCATAAFLGARTGARASWTWRSLIPAGAVAAAVSAGSLLTTFQLAPVVQHDYARNYVEGVLVRADPDPGTSIIDTKVPKLVSGNVDHRDLIWAMGRRATFNQPSTRMQMFDEAARLVPVVIPVPVIEEKGPVADCGWPVGAAPRTLGRVPADAGRDLVLRTGNLSGVAGTLTVRVGDVEQSVALEAGLALAYFFLPEPSGEIEASFQADDDSGTCVTDLLLGPPGTGR